MQSVCSAWAKWNCSAPCGKMEATYSDPRSYGEDQRGSSARQCRSTARSMSILKDFARAETVRHVCIPTQTTKSSFGGPAAVSRYVAAGSYICSESRVHVAATDISAYYTKWKVGHALTNVLVYYNKWKVGDSCTCS